MRSLTFRWATTPPTAAPFENLVEAKKRLVVVVPLALLLILLLLYFAFGSLKLSLLVFSAVPLSAIGGVFALAGRGMPFSISAGVGFIALFGVAVLNGIVLISEFEHLLKERHADWRTHPLQGTANAVAPGADDRQPWPRSASCPWPSATARVRKCNVRWPRWSSVA
jgi:cobalt-zinc-cadmium resistance protein CzcA